MFLMARHRDNVEFLVTVYFTNMMITMTMKMMMMMMKLTVMMTKVRINLALSNKSVFH